MSLNRTASLQVVRHDVRRRGASVLQGPLEERLGGLPEQAQRFLACFEPIRGHFCPRRHLLPAAQYRAVLADRFAVWRQVTGIAA